MSHYSYIMYNNKNLLMCLSTDAYILLSYAAGRMAPNNFVTLIISDIELHSRIKNAERVNRALKELLRKGCIAKVKENRACFLYMVNPDIAIHSDVLNNILTREFRKHASVMQMKRWEHLTPNEGHGVLEFYHNFCGFVRRYFMLK